jgi:formate dehydrogenase subunit gamma
MGGVALAEHVKHRLGCEFNATSTDGAFTLEAVYCLGNCACGPSAMIDGKLYGRVTPKRLDQLIAALEARQ